MVYLAHRGSAGEIGGPRQIVALDSRKRTLEVRILRDPPNVAGVIAIGRHTRLKLKLVVVRIHSPVPKRNS